VAESLAVASTTAMPGAAADGRAAGDFTDQID
jgi:hypothetical protein